VVLLSGHRLDLSPPPSADELVCSLRSRVAKALEMDVERIMLVAGTRVLQNQWSVSTASEGQDLTALIAEAIVDTDDPQHVAEYASELFRSGLQRQRGPLSAINAGVFDRSPSSAPSSIARAANVTSDRCCTPTNRSVIVDWIVEEHQKFELRTETLFLAVAIFDAFLHRRPSATSVLRLVGAAALLIAAKFEEIYPPELRDFVYITDRQYTVDDIKSMEVLVLSVLEFGLAGRTPIHFLDRYQRANRCDVMQAQFVQYLLELALVEGISTHHPPNRLAAAAVYVANRSFRRIPLWTPTMVNYTGHCEEDLAECAEGLQRVFLDVRYSAFQRVRSKLLDRDPQLMNMVKELEGAASPQVQVDRTIDCRSDDESEDYRSRSRSPRTTRW